MPINLFYELKKYEEISYAEAVGWSAFPSSPTDRRPCCACVELTQMGICYTKCMNPPLLPQAISIKQATGESATQIS